MNCLVLNIEFVIEETPLCVLKQLQQKRMLNIQQV